MLYELRVNPKFEAQLEELARKQGVTKSQVLRRAVALLNLAQEQHELGRDLVFTEAGEPVLTVVH